MYQDRIQQCCLHKEIINNFAQEFALNIKGSNNQLIINKKNQITIIVGQLKILVNE